MSGFDSIIKSKISQRGVTLAEVLIVAAVGSIVFLAAQSILLNFMSGQKKAEEMVENATEEQLVVRMLTKDFQRTGLSFGFLQQKDDAGALFFDYAGDAPCMTGACSRNITLSLTGAREFLLLADSELEKTVSDFSVQSLRPADFYQVSGAASTLVAVAANGTLRPPTTLNNAPMVYRSLKDGLTKVNSPLLKETQVIALYSPLTERELDSSTGRVIASSFPERHMILVTIGATETILTSATLSTGGLSATQSLRTVHPAQSGVTISTVDKFFRTLSPIGGKSALVLGRPVRLVRYEVRAAAGNAGQAELYRAEFSSTSKKFENAQRVGGGFEKIILKRSTIGGQNIDIDFVRKRSI